MKPNETRLVLEIDRRLHTHIKMAGAQKHMSMKDWIVCAIIKALEEERQSREKSNE